jgi:maleylacetate reductase
MESFQYVSYAQEVIFGSGSLNQLGEAVQRWRLERVLLVANHTMRKDGHAAAVETLLKDCLVASYDHVLPHVQDVQVDEILQLAAEKEVTAVIGMGGGSPIGMAKAIASALDQQRAGQPPVTVIAIPTTYAGSEMTSAYGITHTRETPTRKVTVSSPNGAPQLVVYDPLLTLDLPPEMTASTGMNALSHCIEALYSIRRNPLSSAAAVSSIRCISNSLLRCSQNGEDLEARSEMLLGAHLAGLALASVAMGLHHGLCHVLGGTANLPHGIANSIILPHAIRFNAEATWPQLLPAAEAMGIASGSGDPAAAVEALAQRIDELARQMGLPRRLRDVGVPETDLPELAQLGYRNRNVQNNPRPVTDAGQIEQLLREAW